MNITSISTYAAFIAYILLDAAGANVGYTVFGSVVVVALLRLFLSNHSPLCVRYPGPALFLFSFEHCIIFGAVWLVGVVNIFAIKHQLFPMTQYLIGLGAISYLLPKAYTLGKAISNYRR